MFIYREIKNIYDDYMPYFQYHFLRTAKYHINMKVFLVLSNIKQLR